MTYLEKNMKTATEIIMSFRTISTLTMSSHGIQNPNGQTV